MDTYNVSVIKIIICYKQRLDYVVLTVALRYLQYVKCKWKNPDNDTVYLYVLAFMHSDMCLVPVTVKQV